MYKLKVKSKGSKRYSNLGSGPSKILWPSRTQQNIAEAADYHKLRQWGIMGVFYNITLITLVVYRWQPQKKSYQYWE